MLIRERRPGVLSACFGGRGLPHVDIEFHVSSHVDAPNGAERNSYVRVEHIVLRLDTADVSAERKSLANIVAAMGKRITGLLHLKTMTLETLHADGSADLVTHLRSLKAGVRQRTCEEASNLAQTAIHSPGCIDEQAIVSPIWYFRDRQPFINARNRWCVEIL